MSRVPRNDRLRVAFINTHRGRALRSGAIKRKLRNRDPEVLGLSECSGKRSQRALRETARQCGYTVHVGDERGAPATPILVRNDITVLSFELEPISPPRWFVGKGAGPSHAKAKYVAIVRLNHAGATWKVGVCHFSPSAHLPFRRKKVRRQADNARKAMRHKVSGSGIRVLIGDFNLDWDTKYGARILRIIRNAGLRFIFSPDTQLPTKGRRTIDHITFGRAAKVVRRTSHHLRHGGHAIIRAIRLRTSDHRWVETDLVARRTLRRINRRRQASK